MYVPFWLISYDIVYLQDVVNGIKHDSDDFCILHSQHVTYGLHRPTLYTVCNLFHCASWSQIGNHPNSLLLALEVTLFLSAHIDSCHLTALMQSSMQIAMWIINYWSWTAKSIWCRTIPAQWRISLWRNFQLNDTILQRTTVRWSSCLHKFCLLFICKI